MAATVAWVILGPRFRAMAPALTLLCLVLAYGHNAFVSKDRTAALDILPVDEGLAVG